jgi:hypothetical protein
MKAKSFRIIIGTALTFLLSFFVQMEVYPQAQIRDTAWHKLFNGKDLTGWNSFLATKEKEHPFLINSDPQKIFQIIDGTIHFYKDQCQDSIVPEGFLYTEQEYSNYRLRLEYKWGAKKYAQRKNKKANSGLMFHVQEPSGFWPTCAECQIMEGSAGDIYAQNYAWFTTTIDSFVMDDFSKKTFPRYAEKGKLFDYGGNQTSMRLMNQRRLDTREGWNTVEIIVQGSSATFVVNGQVSAKLWNIRFIPPNKPENMKTMDKGRIVLQAEATEIIFRNIEIKQNYH